MPAYRSLLDKYKSYEADTVESIDGDVDGTKDDAQFIFRLNQRESQCRPKYEELKELAQDNRDYWKGQQKREKVQYEGEPEDIIVNRIFQSIETMIPIVTRKTPEPNLTVYPGSKNNLRLQEKLERKLKEIWEIDQDMQSKMEAGLRNLFCSRYTAVKYFLDETTGNVGYQLMPMNKLIFPYDSPSVEECPFIIEYVPKSVEQIKKLFPKKAEEFDKLIRQDLGSNFSEDSLVTYKEYWEDGFYACVYKTIVLHREKNPHWNWKNKDFNYFKAPRKPYEFLNHLTFGDSMIDDTSLIEQTKSLQNNIDDRKKQIHVNAEFANGQIAIAGNKINKDEASNITKDPNQIIYLDGADNVGDAIAVFQGRGVGPEIFNDMSHSESEIDNIMGTHSTTRGERDSQETAAGRTILKESDVGRLEILTRRIEKFAQALYGAAVQMIYISDETKIPVYYAEPEGSNRLLKAKEQMDYITKKELRGVEIKVLVQNGSTVPRDKTIEKAEAVDLWKEGGMATVDMYRKLEYPNAERLAKNAYLEKENPQMLYTTPDDGFDVTAMEHIMGIIDGDKVDILKSKNIDEYTKHILTHQEYLKGTQIDSDFIDFADLSPKIKKKMVAHVQDELAFAKELQEKQDKKAAVEQPPQDMMQQPLPMEAPPMDPAMMDPNMMPPEIMGQMQPEVPQEIPPELAMQLMGDQPLIPEEEQMIEEPILA